MNVPLHLNPQIISDDIENNAVLYSPTDGMLFVLCELGTIIWHMLSQQKPLHNISDFVATHYLVSPEQAETDLTYFLKQLQERQLTTS
jgi:hypothetical protein